jgi:CheY-like chemotaxis protein
MAAQSTTPPRRNSGISRRYNPMVVLAIADAASRQRQTRFLTDHGFTVAAVESGPEAVEITTRFLPEIVVLELGDRGADAARSLRSHALTSGVGIVALAPSVGDGHLQIAWDAECDAVLEAPCAPETLLTELLAMLALLAPDSGAAGAT